MTTEERNMFDAFKRELLENPIIGLNFLETWTRLNLITLVI